MQSDDTDKTTYFHLMRHAPTEWNIAGRIQGHADSPLTPTGRLWAAGWGQRLAGSGITQLLCSDTGRALATAQAVQDALDLPLGTDPRLREQDWGQWTGCFPRRLKKESAKVYRRQQARGWQFRPPGGESHLEVLERALSALKDAAARHPGESILVVTHDGVIKCLLYHLAIRNGCGSPPQRPSPWHVHRLAADGSRISLQQINAFDLNAP